MWPFLNIDDTLLNCGQLIREPFLRNCCRKSSRNDWTAGSTPWLRPVWCRNCLTFIRDTTSNGLNPTRKCTSYISKCFISRDPGLPVQGFILRFSPVFVESPIHARQTVRRVRSLENFLPNRSLLPSLKQ